MTPRLKPRVDKTPMSGLTLSHVARPTAAPQDSRGAFTLVRAFCAHLSQRGSHGFKSRQLHDAIAETPAPLRPLITGSMPNHPVCLAALTVVPS